MEHGLAKLSKGPEKTSPAILCTMGVPAPHLMGMAHHSGPSSSAVSPVLLGAFRRTCKSADGLRFLVVAMLTVHLPYGFSSIKLLSVDRPAGPQFRAGRATSLNLLYLALPCGARIRRFRADGL